MGCRMTVFGDGSRKLTEPQKEQEGEQGVEEKNNQSTEKEKREDRKSRVRVYVTYIAALFLFLGGAVFIAFLIWTGELDAALSLFQAVLPVSAAVISFWFAGRSNPK